MAAVGPTGQVGEAEGKIWLFTVGIQGGAPEGGTLVAEIGPLDAPSAAHYALNINYSSTQPFGLGGGVPASRGVHTHPGSEGWYVLAGEQTVWIPGLALRTESGESQAGTTTRNTFDTRQYGQRRAACVHPVGAGCRPAFCLLRCPSGTMKMPARRRTSVNAAVAMSACVFGPRRHATSSARCG